MRWLVKVVFLFKQLSVSVEELPDDTAVIAPRKFDVLKVLW